MNRTEGTLVRALNPRGEVVGQARVSAKDLRGRQLLTPKGLLQLAAQVVKRRALVQQGEPGGIDLDELVEKGQADSTMRVVANKLREKWRRG